MSRATAVATLCIVGLSVGVVACGHAGYITPDYREYTTGGMFRDKYWNFWSGGTKVKLEGEFLRAATEVLGGAGRNKEQLVFYIEVPNGLNPVTVYADRSFASQIYEKKAGQRISVYGKTMSISSRSRLDQGFMGGSLAVQLEKLE